MIDSKTIELIQFSELCKKTLTNNLNYINILDTKQCISNFIDIKNEHIKKYTFSNTSYEISFNLYESKNIIWDTIFIGLHILNQLDEETKNKIEKIAKNNLTISQRNIKPIIDITKLEDYKILTNSIIIVEIISNYLQNNDDISIKNNNLLQLGLNKECIIPINYLNDYSRGIIPNIQDKKIAEKADKAALMLFTYSNFDYKESPNFFYRTHIDRINFLLELVDDDQDKLLKLPSSLFTSVVPVSWIKKILKLANNNIDNLICLPETIFIEQPYIAYIKELLKLVNNDIVAFKDLPRMIFTRNVTLERIQILIENTSKKNIFELKNIPEELFICSEKRLNFFITKTKKNLTLLQGIHPYAFISKTTEERLQILINFANENYKQLVNINPLIYITNNSRTRFLLTLINKNINNLAIIPDIWFNDKKISEKRITFLYKLSTKNLNIAITLPDYLYYEKIATEERINFLFELSKNKIENLKEIPIYYYSSNISEQDIKDAYKFTNNNFKELKNIPLEILTKEINFKEYHDMLSIIVEKEQISYSDYKLIFPFLKDNAYDKKFIYQRLNHLLKIIPNKDKIFDLPAEIFSKNTNNIRITFLLDLLNKDFNKLKVIPKELYSKDLKATRIILLYNLVKKDLDKLNNLPKEIYTYPKVALKSIYNLEVNNKAKPLFGLGDIKVTSLIIFMLTILNNPDKALSINQKLREFEYVLPDNKLQEISPLLEEALHSLNNEVSQLPELITCNDKKDIKAKIIKSLKRVNEKTEILDNIIINQNNEVLSIIKDILNNLRFHINGKKIILEDYIIDENKYRNHTFKLEGTLENFYNLTDSLILKNKLINNKEYTLEITSRITSTVRKKYGKRFINTLLNKVVEYKKISTKMLFIEKELNKLGIKKITFIIENNTVTVRYQDGRKKYTSEIDNLINELSSIK